MFRQNWLTWAACRKSDAKLLVFFPPYKNIIDSNSFFSAKLADLMAFLPVTITPLIGLCLHSLKLHVSLEFSVRKSLFLGGGVGENPLLIPNRVFEASKASFLCVESKRR